MGYLPSWLVQHSVTFITWKKWGAFMTKPHKLVVKSQVGKEFRLHIMSKSAGYLQKMRESELVNIDNPIPKDMSGL